MGQEYSDKEMQALMMAGKMKQVELPKSAPNEYSDEDMQRMVRSGLMKPAEKNRENPDDQPILSGIEGFGNAVTLGYLPQLQALTDTTIDKFTDPNYTNFEDEYLAHRDDNLKRQESHWKNNPVASGVGTLAGAGVSGVASAPLMGEAAATGLGRVAQAAKQGAAMGLLANPGDEEGKLADGLQLSDRLHNAAVGGAVGAGSAGAIEGVSGVAGRASQFLRGQAEKKALKAMGPYARDAMKAMAKDEINSTGRVLLDEGVVGGAPTSFSGLADRAETALQSKGQQIGDYLEELSEAERKLTGNMEGVVPLGHKPQMSAGVDRARIAQSLREDLLNPNTDIPGIAAKNAKVERLISEFENGGDGLLPVLQAEAKKVSVGKEIKWDRLPGSDIPLEEEVQRALYNKLKNGVEDAGQFLENEVGSSPGKFMELKDDYGALKKARDIVKRREAKEFANRFLSPSDYLTGGLGATAGFASGDSVEDKIKNAAIGGAIGVGHKFIRQYGNQVMAPVLDRLATQLAKVPRFAELAQKNPTAFQGIVAAVANSTPSFKKQSGFPEHLDDELLGFFKKNPEALERVQNSRLREAIKMKLGSPTASLPEK